MCRDMQKSQQAVRYALKYEVIIAVSEVLHSVYKHTHGSILANACRYIMEQLMDGGECWEEVLLRRVKIHGCQVLIWYESYLMLCFVVT